MGHADSVSYWMLGLTFFGAFMTAGSILSTVAFRFMKLTVDKSILEANSKQIEQMQTAYIPSAAANLTGAEIVRVFEKIQKDILSVEESQKRHSRAQLDLVHQLTIELEKLKVRVASAGGSGE